MVPFQEEVKRSQLYLDGWTSPTSKPCLVVDAKPDGQTLDRGLAEGAASSQELRKRRVIDPQEIRKGPERVLRMAGASQRQLLLQAESEIESRGAGVGGGDDDLPVASVGCVRLCGKSRPLK